MFKRFKSANSWFRTLKKNFYEVRNCRLLIEMRKDTMLSQINVSQNSRQMIDNTHNDFQPFACIMTERFDNTQMNNQTIISGKRVKISVEKRRHKIKQTNY